jgi:hypothetical protein
LERKACRKPVKTKEGKYSALKTKGFNTMKSTRSSARRAHEKVTASNMGFSEFFNLFSPPYVGVCLFVVLVALSV